MRLFYPPSVPALWDRDGTPAKMQQGYREAGGKMSKNSTSRSTSARKSLSHARPEKKKIRRAIFKADQWYENAAMSIGIAGRPKGARPGAALIPRAKDRAD
jgi:hypothetical protein